MLRVQVTPVPRRLADIRRAALRRWRAARLAWGLPEDRGAVEAWRAENPGSLEVVGRVLERWVRGEAS